VQVHEARRRQLARRVVTLRAAVDGDRRGGQRGDLAVLDPDVALATQPLRRIENVGVGDDLSVASAGSKPRGVGPACASMTGAVAGAPVSDTPAASVPEARKSRRETSMASPTFRRDGS